MNGLVDLERDVSDEAETNLPLLGLGLKGLRARLGGLLPSELTDIAVGDCALRFGEGERLLSEEMGHARGDCLDSVFSPLCRLLNVLELRFSLGDIDFEPSLRRCRFGLYPTSGSGRPN